MRKILYSCIVLLSGVGFGCTDYAFAKNVFVTGPCKCIRNGSDISTYSTNFCVSTTVHDMCSEAKRACKADQGNINDCNGHGGAIAESTKRCSYPGTKC